MIGIEVNIRLTELAYGEEKTIDVYRDY